MTTETPVSYLQPCITACDAETGRPIHTDDIKAKIRVTGCYEQHALHGAGRDGSN